MSSFPASLVTPERTVLDTEVQAVMLRTVDGEAAFLPGHTDLVGALVPGPVRFQHQDGTEERAAVHGGFVQVHPDHVVVLAPIAELEGEIDLDRARRALEEADQALAELGTAAGEEEAGAGLRRLELEDARRRAQLRIEVVSPGS